MIKKFLFIGSFFSTLGALTACSTAPDRSPQSTVRQEFNRFQLMHPVAIQNATAYTVETVLLSTKYCKLSVTLPPGEEFKMNTKENLLVTAYTVSDRPSQEVKIDFVPVKKRPMKMRCEFPPKTGFAEQKVAQEFNTTFLTYYAGNANTNGYVNGNSGEQERVEK